MYTMLALPAVGTESSEIELTKLSPDVAVWTSGTLFAKPLVVVFTHWQLGTFLDMDVETLVTILTVAILVVELTLAHLSKVVFVQIVASIAFLAQALEPMFAYIIVILVVAAEVVVLILLWSWSRVSVGTASAARAVS
jgi:hypothetical protein